MKLFLLIFALTVLCIPSFLVIGVFIECAIEAAR
jgi:hypothetical protein